MPLTGRGAWYECVGGLGLEVESDPGRWYVAGHIEAQGKRKPMFAVHINRQEESYIATTCRTMEDAKEYLVERFHVAQIIKKPFSWMKPRFGL